jgi:hypothetical protein
MENPGDHLSSGASSKIDPLLLEYIAKRDAPCPVCGYNLRQLTHDVCPECGQQFRLTVGAVNARFASLLLFVAPMIMVCGLSLLFLIICVFDPAPGQFWGIYATMILGALDAGATILLYRKRAWFLTCSASSRRVLVILSLGLHAILVAAFFAFGVR